MGLSILIILEAKIEQFGSQRLSTSLSNTGYEIHSIIMGIINFYEWSDCSGHRIF